MDFSTRVRGRHGMGVKNWKKIVTWQVVGIDEISPPAVAIDVPNYMIRRLAVVSKRGSANMKRVPLTHISLVLGVIRAALRRNILPVFVVDGPPESLKRAPQSELVMKATELYRRFKESGDSWDSTVALALNVSPALRTYFAAEHIKDVCSAVGVPAIGAPSEAEMLCAILCRERLVGSVATNDADAILFGSPHASRKLELTKGQIERTRLVDIEVETGLDLEQLRDLAILCGCDFHKGLKGVGPRKGVTLLQRYGSLVPVLKAKGVRASERESFVLAREVFDEPSHISVKGIEVTIKPPIVPRLVKILTPVMGQERAEVRTADFVRLWKDFGKEQTTIEQWV
ncbi:MAG: hypothetical protein ACW968_06230 [Candidatus Thorarchaeota archaeon]|jgi:flap endonuclease-1